MKIVPIRSAQGSPRRTVHKLLVNGRRATTACSARVITNSKGITRRRCGDSVALSAMSARVISRIYKWRGALKSDQDSALWRVTLLRLDPRDAAGKFQFVAGATIMYGEIDWNVTVALFEILNGRGCIHHSRGQ